MKLCVFPNDPLIAYYEKGEIKEGYFNPGNLFEEIHCISNSLDDIEVEKVQKLAGNAKFFIHCVGKINLKNYKRSYPKIIKIIQEINPNILRAYNPYIEGWLAAKCSTELNIPLVVSLHTQYDFRKEKNNKVNLKKYFALKMSQKYVEPYVIQNATKIIVIYDIIKSYVKKFTDKEPETLYNKVNQKIFFPNLNKKINSIPHIIAVGNLSEEKNHQCLIEAMKGINAKLTIIGKGELYEKLVKVIQKYSLQNKVEIISSIPHQQIAKYYKNADIFTLAYNPKIESIPMPVMEAMSCGLPVIIPKSPKGFSTGLEGFAIVVERNPESFRKKINWILNNTDEFKKFSEKSKQKSNDFNAIKIEKREIEIYQELTKKQ
jgi:glycosyltransferase involved in cell wall biosynthesis